MRSSFPSARPEKLDVRRSIRRFATCACTPGCRECHRRPKGRRAASGPAVRGNGSAIYRRFESLGCGRRAEANPHLRREPDTSRPWPRPAPAPVCRWLQLNWRNPPVAQTAPTFGTTVRIAEGRARTTRRELSSADLDARMHARSSYCIRDRPGSRPGCARPAAISSSRVPRYSPLRFRSASAAFGLNLGSS